jgi:NAD(P)-dependent dehydrogenase (short-subunit alcohol dehydrogenase family)
MNYQKAVLITGASSGIGRATAEHLRGRGYRVIGTARNPAGVAPIQGVELLPLDVRDDASVEACVATVLRAVGRIDVLVNNAGYSVVGAVEEASPSEAQALFDTNVFGALRMVRAVLPLMRGQGSGLIINTSSVLGFLPAPFMGLYASTKHALEGLSESLDHEVRGFGIRVILIQPTFTNTLLDINAVQTGQRIDSYSALLKRASTAVTAQVKSSQGPETVAVEIQRAIEGPHKLRRPVGSKARLLSRLRRFAPVGLVDRGLRKTFGLL